VSPHLAEFYFLTLLFLTCISICLLSEKHIQKVGSYSSVLAHFLSINKTPEAE
jgi:hypothetical protein